MKRFFVCLGIFCVIVFIILYGFVRTIQVIPMQDLVVSADVSRDLEIKLRLGGDPNAVDENNVPIIFKPLDGYSNAEVVRLLVEYGANVNVRNDKGELPHFLAAKKDDYDSFAILFESYSDLSREDLVALQKVSQDPRIIRLLKKKESSPEF